MTISKDLMQRLLTIFISLNMLMLPSYAIIEDDFVNATLDKNLKIKKQKETTPNSGIPIQIRIKEDFTTKSKPEEGDFIEFETVEDFKSFSAGTTVKGRIEFISMNCIWGVPADIVIGNFQIGNIALYGEIHKGGANRIIWLRPATIVGTFFFGAGLALIPIRGGHAKIKPEQIYTVYYR